MNYFYYILPRVILDKYEKAMKRAKQAEETSNIDSSESESEGMDKRPRKRIDYAESGGLYLLMRYIFTTKKYVTDNLMRVPMVSLLS